MNLEVRKKCIELLWSVPILVALDLASKAWVSSVFRLGQSKEIIPGFFHFTLVHNRGAAFGMGNRWPMFLFVAVSVFATAVVVYLILQTKPHEKFSRWGLYLILAGAIGNLVDRIRLGYVVDFLDVFVGKYHWPAFNLADSWITIGAVLFGLEILLSKRDSEKTES